MNRASLGVLSSQIRYLVMNELQDRNRPEIASSYTGYSEHHDLRAKSTLDDKELVLDIVAAQHEQSSS